MPISINNGEIAVTDDAGLVLARINPALDPDHAIKVARLLAAAEELLTRACELVGKLDYITTEDFS